MRFQVYKDGKILENFDLYGAYLIGTDGISIRRAQITYENGVIDCKKPNMETAALAFLWPVEGFGKVLLQTTCLPESEKPYILNVEFARAKLMQIVNKREDWSFFDGSEDIGDISTQGQDLFIKAIQSISNPSTAAKLADESLKKSIVYAEKLAVQQSIISFQNRCKNRGYGRGSLGCAIDPSRINEPAYVQKITDIFGLVSVPINWANIEAEKGAYDFTAIDNVVKLFSKKKVIMAGGPLLRFSMDSIPRWLLEGKDSFEKVREASYQFVLNTVGRYGDAIRVWKVINGINAFNHFGFNFEQIIEITRAGCMAVRAASDRAMKIVEITNPWGEYYANVQNTVPPHVYLDMIIQSGINFDAFGLQMRFGKNQDGMHIRDMLQISAILDTIAPVGKPLSITGLEVPSANGADAYDSSVAGVWHGSWDNDQQGKWMEQFYKIALSKPYVDSLTYSALCDSSGSIIKNSGLLTEKLEPKQSYLALMKLREVMFAK